MIWATVSSWSCFCWQYRTSPSLAAKNIINLISVLTISWRPHVVFSHVVGRECLLGPVHSLDKTLLIFVLLHFVLYFIDYAKAFDSVDHNKLWKILQEMGIPDHLKCLLRNLYAGQEATVKTRHGTTNWFQIGKGICQGCILSPCLFKLYAENIMRNAGLEEAQAGIRLLGEISITSDIQMTPPLWQKVKS